MTRIRIPVVALAAASLAAGAGVFIGGPGLVKAEPEAAVEAFAQTVAAATGRQVPAGVGSKYQNYKKPRIVGRDSTGQEFAVSSGTAGVCLIAVREPGKRPGFESCGPRFRIDRRGKMALRGGKVQTTVMTAGPKPARPLPAGAERVAPGLYVSVAPGELPGP